jgi:hypothetical protein
MKLNVDLDLSIAAAVESLLKKYKDVFTWSYKDIKGMLPHIAQHQIKLDTTILPFHHNRYWMNPNYVVVVKQDQDKLLIASFIASVEDNVNFCPLWWSLRKMVNCTFTSISRD